MKASEIDQDYGYYDPEEDKLSRFKTTDTRKDRLSLRDINKLKKIRATRRLEALRRRDSLEIIYGPPSGDGGGGMGGMGF